MLLYIKYSGQIYAEPHKSYENVTYAGASPISEADSPSVREKLQWSFS
jgi:hypothetical protein